jgi:hypothetical protein
MLQNKAWLGLSLLATGLSLDELGSIHERSKLFFSTWGLAGNMSSKIPLALPAIVILIVTLREMWRHGCRRHFYLTLSAFALFSSVAFQEYLEFSLNWPWWAQGLRVGFEEGTELLGVFLLLCVVASPVPRPESANPLAQLVPRARTFIALKPTVVLVTLLSLFPLTELTATLTDLAYRGIPATWLPFMLLNLAWMSAWACAQFARDYRRAFFLASFLAFFFSLDQIIVFERIIDKQLVRGELGNWMFPCLAFVCMAIPELRTRSNLIIVGTLLPLGLLLKVPSLEIVPWLVISLHSLGIFSVLVSGLEGLITRPARPTAGKRITLP